MAFAIDFLRHGATGCTGFRGSTDDALSAQGWRDTAAATHTAGPWQAIVTSPLQRCAAFARAEAQRLGLPLRVDERLAEYHFGDWEGMSAETLMQKDAAALARFWQDPWQHPPPNAETMNAFEARVMAAWQALAQDGQPALVVTHGGVMRLLLCLLQGRARSEFLSIDVPPASLHQLPA